MEVIKFKYLAGFCSEQIFTLEQIEFGDVIRWIKNNNINIEDIKRYQYINFKDTYDAELYENDLILVYMNNKLVGEAVIKYDNEISCFAMVFNDGTKNIIGMVKDMKIIKYEEEEINGR
jgi:hypothetical protein